MIPVAKHLFLAYIVLKPFYIFGSGGVQPADALLILSSILVIVSSVYRKDTRKQLYSSIGKHKFFVIFAALATLINVTYMLFLADAKFIMSSLYFVFNAVAIISTYMLIKDRTFIGKAGNAFKAGLFIQLAIFTTGMGRYYTPDRYMGTFNDPNQFGYFVLLSFLFIYIIDRITITKYTWVYYILSLFLILQSGSTGMLIGVVAFTLMLMTHSLFKELSSPTRLVRKVVLLSLTILILTPFAVLVAPSYINTNPVGGSDPNPLVERLNEKADKASGEKDMSLFEDRNLDTITKYPKYIIFGSGEGAFDRFQGVTFVGSEVHSTFPSLLFYYGIIPFIFLIFWIHRQLKGSGWISIIVCISLFAVSFVLLNQRQALFWVLIMICGLYGPSLSRIVSKGAIESRSSRALR